MNITDFGDALIRTRDLDPVYVAIAGADLPRDQLCRLLIAYWCFYHLGAAAFLSEAMGDGYWAGMTMAAQNLDLYPRRPCDLRPTLEGVIRWPRATERRHFRGQKCVDAVRWLSKESPESRVQRLSKYTLADGIIDEVKSWPQFGPWIAFKAADMMERCFRVAVHFNPDIGMMYEEPREGLNLMADQPEYGHLGVEGAYGYLRNYFSALPAPPLGDRPCGPQEVETVLCKWKSHMNGGYTVGKDIREVRHALAGWGRTADLMLAACPEEVPDGRYVDGRTPQGNRRQAVEPEVQDDHPGRRDNPIRVHTQEDGGEGGYRHLQSGGDVAGRADIRVDEAREHASAVQEFEPQAAGPGGQRRGSVEQPGDDRTGAGVRGANTQPDEDKGKEARAERKQDQGSPVAINLRGTGGSGKSTVVRRLMDMYDKEPVHREGRKQPLYYVLSRPEGRQLAVIGHYETACGGCDTIKTPDEAYQLVRDNLELGRDVVYEGIIIQDETGRLAALHRQIGDNLHVIALNTPIEECLRSIQQRRDERDDKKPLNEKNTRDRAKRLQSGMAKVRFLGIKTYTLDREAALAKCRELLGL